jgi:hypothetical protein
VVFAWAETPREIEAVSSAVRVSTEGSGGPDGTTRCLFGPEEFQIPAGEFAVSVIVGRGDVRFLQVALNGDSEHFANFDLEEGMFARKGDRAPSAQATPLGQGWYRLDVTFTLSQRDSTKGLRRLLIVDRGDVGHHPRDTKSRGYFLLASPRLEPTSPK